MMTEFENVVAGIVDPKGDLSLDDILKLVVKKFTSTKKSPKLPKKVKEVLTDVVFNNKDVLPGQINILTDYFKLL